MSLLKHLLPALLICLSGQVWASFNDCAEHFVGSEAVVRKQSADQYELCNKGYAILFDGNARIPILAFAHVTPEELAGARKLSRAGIGFDEDHRVAPQHRSSPLDYLRSGYDRGHMIGNAFFYDKTSQVESFLMTNISPQLPHLNREVFSKVEQDTRKYVRRTGNAVFVIVGVHNEVTHCQYRINGRVCVIDNLFMAVIDPIAGKSWAHWLHNAGDAQVTAPISITELEQRLGYRIIRETN